MLEAAALGIPIVSTKICGMLDFVQSGVNGVLCEIGNAEDLFSVLDKLIKEPNRIHQMGQQAQRLALNQSWYHVARKIEAVYIRAKSCETKSNHSI